MPCTGLQRTELWESQYFRCHRHSVLCGYNLDAMQEQVEFSLGESCCWRAVDEGVSLKRCKSESVGFCNLQDSKVQASCSQGQVPARRVRVWFLPWTRLVEEDPRSAVVSGTQTGQRYNNQDTANVVRSAVLLNLDTETSESS